MDGLEVVAGAAVDLEDEEGEVDGQQGLDIVTGGKCHKTGLKLMLKLSFGYAVILVIWLIKLEMDML